MSRTIVHHFGGTKPSETTLKQAQSHIKVKRGDGSMLHVLNMQMYCRRVCCLWQACVRLHLQASRNNEFFFTLEGDFILIVHHKIPPRAC